MLTFVRLKRIISIVLLLLFIYGTVGYFVAFQVERYTVRQEIKHRIKQGVPTEELTIISDDATNSRLNWVKPNKEFRINGKMYDVVSKRVEGNTVYYSCINDTQEDKLFENLDKQVDNALNDSGKKNTKNNLKDYIPAERFTPKQVGLSFTSTIYTPDHYQSPNLELVTPPPPFLS